MKNLKEIYMEVQDIECPNVNNLTLPEDWQLKAMKEHTKQYLNELLINQYEIDDEVPFKVVDVYVIEELLKKLEV